MGHTCEEPNEIELTPAHELFYRSCVCRYGLCAADYDAQEDTELSMKVGDRVRVVGEEADGWQKGMIGGSSTRNPQPRPHPPPYIR